jgi:hypothetical protein
MGNELRQRNPVSMAFSGLVRAVFHTESCLSLKDGEFLIISPSILKIVGCQWLETWLIVPMNKKGGGLSLRWTNLGDDSG